MIDAHAHLSDLRLTPMVDQVAECLKAGGLTRIVLGGVEPGEWRQQRQLTGRFSDFVISALGIHPWTVRDSTDDALEDMFRILERERDNFTILGECGLDFYGTKNPDERQRQARWCERQLRLAVSLRKPVVLHVVRGHDVMLGILRGLRESGHGMPRGIVHGFTGNADVGQRYLDQGFILSFGRRSFQNRNPRDFIWLPRDAFAIESDAPPTRAPMDSPAQIAGEWLGSLRECAEFLARAWDISEDDVWSLADRNTTQFLASGSS